MACYPVTQGKGQTRVSLAMAIAVFGILASPSSYATVSNTTKPTFAPRNEYEV